MTTPTRRDFLKSAVALGGAGLLGGSMSRPASAADVRAYAGGRVGLELDGQFVDFLKSADGGFAKADVIIEPQGTSYFPKKHIGQPKYDTIAMQCELAMPKALAGWVGTTLTSKYARKNGVIINAGLDLKEQSRLQFFNAMITEIGFPACDASSKEAGYLTVKLAPEYTRAQGGGGMMKADAAKASKAWLSQNFKLSISGLETTSVRVTRIEPLVIKLPVTQSAVGEQRDYQKEQGRLEFPNLVVTLPESQAGQFYSWFEDFVIKGNSADSRERQGQLDFLAPSRQSTLLSLRFDHLGIYSFAPQPQTAGSEKIRSVKVEMYCEQITLGPTVPFS